ncbi:MAG: NAD(P)/FAD-dependent oxidoreductase [Planctomycetota bacterium]|jgi:thioredoxin reductase (NADPH)
MAEERDVVIIGAGPAGLAAAVYTGRALMKTTVLEKLVVGGQIIEAYDVDNYPGFPDGVAGPDLVERMLAHAKKFDVEVVSKGATDVVVDGARKRVLTGDGEYVAPIVIVASGATHRKLGVPGEQELSGKGVSYCATCDGPFFRDKQLVVIGGGDAALTEAVFLTRFATGVKLIHRRQGFRGRAGHVKEARENDKIEFILDTIVTEILGQDHVEGVTVRNVQTGGESRLDCDGVFMFVGHDPNTEFLGSLLPEFAGGVIPVDYNMETDVKGLYAVGDVRMGSYRQVGTAIGEAITAAMHAEVRIKDLSEQGG